MSLGITELPLDSKQVNQKFFVDQSLAESNPSILAHPLKDASLNFQQIPGRVQFCDGSLLQHQDSVVVQHCVQPVGDGDDCASLELCPYSRLDQIIGLKVNSCGCLVQH